MLFLPFVCSIESIQSLTDTDKLFRVKRLDDELFNYQPGQFFQVSLPGFGEAPISVASSNLRGDYLELGVRKAGSLTAALHALKVGDEIGLRGPFGTCFPVDDFLGKAVILIAGGCGLAPLRALIQTIEDRRDEFGSVTILYGAKSPDDVMFKENIAVWSDSEKMNMELTVDNAERSATCWTGNVGLITNLVSPLKVDAKNTAVVLCGPPVMYQPVINELRKKKIEENQIIVSLERHMKCGVGKCGHCSIEHLYCCTDGPVFNFAEIKNIRGAI